MTPIERYQQRLAGRPSAPDADEQRWNHNIHYRPVIFAAVPVQCRRALEVGCGEGTLARELRGLVPRVTAIDRDESMIELARHRDRDEQPIELTRGHDRAPDIECAGEVDYVLGDFMTYPLTVGAFDFIACVAALHHVDEEAALRRLRDLLAPGGTLAILGLARSRYPGDLPRDIAAVAVHRLRRARTREWQSPAPTVWPPPHTYAEIRSLAERVLPGSRFRRHLLWRYSLVWRKAVREFANRP